MCRVGGWRRRAGEVLRGRPPPPRKAPRRWLPRKPNRARVGQDAPSGLTKVATGATFTGMRSVATKELKDRLSHYLRLVRAGARFVVTDRGRPVAELGPVPAAREREDRERAWIEAAARGAVTLPRRRRFGRFRPIRLRGGATLSGAVLEERR